MEHMVVTQMLIILFAIVLSFLLALWFTSFFMEFSSESKYIKFEMKKANKDDKRYWERELHRHYLSLIPFVHFNND